MRIALKKSMLAITVTGVLASPAVNATNGYFSHGYSTKEKGLAGAGAALSQDAMASATNPAGLAFIGERMDIGAAMFSPSPRSYTVTGNVVPPPPQPGSNPALPYGSGINAMAGQTVDSDKDFFLIPHFAYNWQISSEEALGVAVYGNGGMNTEYAASATPFGAGTFGGGTAGLNLEQLFVNISMAKMMNDKHAFGFSVILAGQRFSAQGLEGFSDFSLDSNNLSGNRHSTAFGAGVKLGYQGEVAKGVRVGVSYQSKVSMSEFDEYKGLFAESGDFDIPSTYTFGAAFDVGTAGVIVADIQRINYTDVAAVSNPVANLLTGCSNVASAGCLGGSNGGSFGWNDMTIYKVGYQFVAGDNTYRVGYSYAESPITDTETLFNILAPAVIEEHFTAGMTMKMAGNQELNLSGMYAPSNAVKGANPMDGGQSQIEIEMSQWEVQAGWAWKY